MELGLPFYAVWFLTVIQFLVVVDRELRVVFFSWLLAGTCLDC